MKNLIILFVLTLLTASVQSQSLTEKEIMGTWQVVNIENSSSDPETAQKLERAYFDFYTDGSFAIRSRQNDSGKQNFKIISPKDAKWNYDAESQTIHIAKNNTVLKVEGNADNAIFTIKETGMKLRVTKPI